MWSTRWRAAARRICRMSQGAVGPADLGRTERRFTAPKSFGLLAAGQAAHPMAGQRQGRRQIFRCVLCDAVSVAGRQREIAADQPRRRGRAARQDRPGDRADPFAVGRLRLADRRRAAEAGEGADLDRAERPAGLRDRRSRAPPDWFEDTGPRKPYGLGFVPMTYDPPLKPGEQLVIRAPGQARRAGPGARLAAGRAGAQAAQSGEGADADRGGGSLVSRGVRSLHRGLSRAGRRAGHVPAARGRRHPRQRPHDDAGKEQRRDRRRAGWIGLEEASAAEEAGASRARR